MKKQKNIAALIAILLLVLFNPVIYTTPDGDFNIGIESVYADDGAQNNSNSNSNSSNQSGSNDQNGKKEEEEDTKDDSDTSDSDSSDDTDSTKTTNSSSNANNSTTDKGKEKSTNTISREEYEALQAKITAIEEKATQQTINERLELAKKEQYIDPKNEEAVKAIKELAKNDAAWAAYVKTAKPIVPGHIAARNHFATKTKSTQAPSNPIMDKVLEHQKITQD
jgi:phage I-like protein